MKSRITSLLAAAAVVATGAAHAATVSYDFETDQSASFTVYQDNAADNGLDFQYDYSTFSNLSGSVAWSIPAAPNSASGTTGLRMDSNISGAGVDNQLAAYMDITSLDLSSGYVLTFDVYASFNGDLGTGSGSTESFAWGAQSASGVAGVANTNVTGDGYNIYITSEGGSASDYRYSEGTAGLASNNALPNWNGVGEVNNADATWSAFFPNDGVAPNTLPASGATSPGAPGKQWITVRFTDDGTTRTTEFKKAGDASFTTVSAFTGGVGSAANPFIGYMDIFTSSPAVPAADNFVVFDNVVVSDDLVTNVNDWTLY